MTRESGGESLSDSYGRFARKLRISVTDRCNFRCDFCMPEKPVWLDQSEVLNFEEFARVTGILAKMGVRKVRLSGGEPLMRKDVERLVRMLVRLKGIQSVAMTTNGALLSQKAASLKKNGLREVTVSLHSLKPRLYDRITGTEGVFWKVLEGVQEAESVGLGPVKINCVVTRGCNDGEVLDFAKMAHDTGRAVRFIEYMPFDGTKVWNDRLLVSGDEILKSVSREHAIEPMARERGSTSTSYRFLDGSGGSIATITSMSRPFCADCDRIRLKANGGLVPCLFSMAEYDMKHLLRGGASDQEIEEAIRSAFLKKFEGVAGMVENKVEVRHVQPMHSIGG
ncbi:MAG TPA: GTP 3',8-cyclase MoaA [Nitrososphaerales archaeon]|nr:GTP 3',8-cyclase MoaA [Nitrososphaerales archaeon]